MLLAVLHLFVDLGRLKAVKSSVMKGNFFRLSFCQPRLCFFHCRAECASVFERSCRYVHQLRGYAVHPADVGSGYCSHSMPDDSDPELKTVKKLLELHDIQ